MCLAVSAVFCSEISAIDRISREYPRVLCQLLPEGDAEFRAVGAHGLVEYPEEWPHSFFRRCVGGGLYQPGWMRSAGEPPETGERR